MDGKSYKMHEQCSWKLFESDINLLRDNSFDKSKKKCLANQILLASKFGRPIVDQKIFLKLIISVISRFTIMLK